LKQRLNKVIEYLKEQAEHMKIESEKAGTFAERDYYHGMHTAYMDVYKTLLNIGNVRNKCD
jgi:hypothetical protein